MATIENHKINLVADWPRRTSGRLANQIPKVYGRQETAGKTLDFGILDGLQKILSQW